MSITFHGIKAKRKLLYSELFSLESRFQYENMSIKITPSQNISICTGKCFSQYFVKNSCENRHQTGQGLFLSFSQTSLTLNVKVISEKNKTEQKLGNCLTS